MLRIKQFVKKAVGNFFVWLKPWMIKAKTHSNSDCPNAAISCLKVCYIIQLCQRYFYTVPTPFLKEKKIWCATPEGNQEHLLQILFASMDLQRKAKHRHQSCKRVDQISRAPVPDQELEKQKLDVLYLFREHFSGLNTEIIRMGATIPLPLV